MKTKPLTFLLSLLAIAFLITGFLVGDAYGQASSDEGDRLLEYGERIQELGEKLRKKKEPITNENRKEFEEKLQLAKQGNAEAQRSVENMYKRGLGTQRDAKKAIEWYTLSPKMEMP